MTFIRSLVSKRRAHIVAVIRLFSEIMPSCSCYEEKKLVYIIIIAPFSRQPFLYIECTKLNIRSSCNIKLVSNAKYIFRFFYLAKLYFPVLVVKRRSWFILQLWLFLVANLPFILSILN